MHFLILLHAEIGIGNKIIYTYFDWINEGIEPVIDDELELTNSLPTRLWWMDQ